MYFNILRMAFCNMRSLTLEDNFNNTFSLKSFRTTAVVAERCCKYSEKMWKTGKTEDILFEEGCFLSQHKQVKDIKVLVRNITTILKQYIDKRDKRTNPSANQSNPWHLCPINPFALKFGIRSENIEVTSCSRSFSLSL